MEYVLEAHSSCKIIKVLQELASNYSGRKAARVKFSVAFANSSSSSSSSSFFSFASRLVKS